MYIIYIYIHTYCVTIKFLGQFVHFASSCAGSFCISVPELDEPLDRTHLKNPKQSQPNRPSNVWVCLKLGYSWISPIFWLIVIFTRKVELNAWGEAPLRGCDAIKAAPFQRHFSWDGGGFLPNRFLCWWFAKMFFFLGGSLKRRQCGPWINLTMRPRMIRPK